MRAPRVERVPEESAAVSERGDEMPATRPVGDAVPPSSGRMSERLQQPHIHRTYLVTGSHTVEARTVSTHIPGIPPLLL